MAGKRDDASGRRGQGLVEGGGHSGMVLLVREERWGKAQLVEAGRRRAHGVRGSPLKAAVCDVRSRHQHAPRAAASQVRQHVWQRRAHGPAARTSAGHRSRANRRRKLVRERRNAHVALLARQAASYDQM